jgi:cell filamentation protein
MKNRGLETASGNFFVAYSPMNAASQAKIEDVLKDAKPAKLAQLDTPEFTKTIAKVYAELDYLHPFADGNSRTLRTFTKQLANEAGYELDWERFNRSAGTRDALYVARDKAVNAIALPQMTNERSMMRIVGSMDRLEANKNLEQILEGAARPLRAIAFEQLPAADALRKHPELEGAYKTLSAATSFSRTLANEADQVRFVTDTRAAIQARLETGKLPPPPPMKERDQGRER